jgi:hypothetical protein
MLIDYKVFKQANLRSPDNKQVNLSAFDGESYIRLQYLAMDLYFI